MVGVQEGGRNLVWLYRPSCSSLCCWAAPPASWTPTPPPCHHGSPAAGAGGGAAANPEDIELVDDEDEEGGEEEGVQLEQRAVPEGVFGQLGEKFKRARTEGGGEGEGT